MSSYFFFAVATCVAVTFALRTVPFLVKTRLYGSALLENFGRWMPMGAMFILALYCLTGVNWGSTNINVGYGLGLAATVVVHAWRRNAVLSIVAGTAVCVCFSTFLA
ncbi:AzlD domain-containing protein [Corynebacterium sp. H128]|uniref:branched-chain amino acid transporter permease n=1 Tax=unclassified Corynebacterium TaxID=2624378 RepID=UPI0030A28504